MTYINVIHANIFASIRTLLQESEKYGPVTPQNSASAAALAELKNDDEKLDARVANHILILWKDAGIQKTYQMRAKYQLTDSTAYFFDRLPEIVKSNYIPIEQDVLRSRVRTTGVVENEFEIENNKFKMIDVGGQRNERKKWIHCFEGVTAVIFVAALSEYDQVCFEDESQNRMVEALTLFDDICNSKWFERTSLILFLNKRDLFAEKILRVPLTVCFPEYSGEMTFEAASQFLQACFEQKNRVPEKTIYTHVTCATDTNNVSVVFNSVKDTIIRQSLQHAGLL